MMKKFISIVIVFLLFLSSCQKAVVVPEAVDLGLPSGLCWASFNLGASDEREAGDFYAWGELNKKREYSWKTYKWCYYNSSFSHLIQKYGEIYGTDDFKWQIETEDDAASVLLGGNWRVPTKDDWMELLECCDWTCKTVDGYSNIIGYCVKSRVNSNQIFLPAAGFKFDKSLGNESEGYYWSSSVVEENANCAYSLQCRINSDPCVVDSFSYRAYGMLIRPVMQK